MQAPVSSLEVAGCVIDLDAGVLLRAGRRVELRAKTWALLECLARRPGRLCSREELKRLLWPGLVVVDDSLTQCVLELRRALGDGERRIVKTVARRGYRLDGCRADVPAALGEAWETLRRIEGPQAIAAAREVFERAYGDGHRRAEALAGIALSHVILVLNRWSRAPQWQVKIASDAAREALALDERLAMAHHACAHVAALQARPGEAVARFRRALALDPQLAHAQVRLAVLAIEDGRASDAPGLLDAALAAAPAPRHLQAQAAFVRGMAQFHCGRDVAALASIDLALALQPTLAFAHQWKASMCALDGRERAAEAHLASFRALLPGQTIDSLEATERSRQPQFRRERRRFYEGLRRAGLPRV